MVERSLLLALMRRIRGRRRWMAAVQGGAVAVAFAGPVLAAATVILRQGAGVTPGVGPLAAALLVVAGMGAGARALRRISLTSCARSVDRALGAERSGDCVLAAVALVERAPAPTAFVAAVISDAAARASRVSPARAIPWPSRRRLAGAVAGVGVLVAAGLVPAARSSASTGVTLAVDGTTTANNPLPIPTPAPPIRLSGLALESEMEDARRAALAARDAADTTLAGLASEFERVLSDLSGEGLQAAAAVARLSSLTEGAQDATDSSKAAKAAAGAGAAALAAARDVGTDGASLATAIAENSGTTDAAAEAARRLAARGDNGRATLAEAVAAAVAALTAAAGGNGTDAGNRGSGDDAERRRRLDPQSDSPRSTDGAPGQRGPRDHQRRLRQLRRDLEQTRAECRGDPEACRQNAEQAGRSLADLQRQGRTAGARQRLAEAARQLLDRIRRGGGTSGEREQLRRFARAARGGGGGGENASDPSQDPRGGQSPGAIALGEAGPGGDDDPAGASGDEGGDAEANTGGPEGAGAAVAGGGIGTEPGGPVLGSRTTGGTAGGRETPARVRDDPAGPSRATIIGGAAARGFASAGYRRVFDDYHAAIEESLDTTVVPPGRRYLVRRYFQLIRPRTP